MSWRVVVISSIAKLDYKMDYLVVRNPEGTKRIHLSEISVLMIESTAVSLTAYLLCELAKRKIDVIFCDEKRLPMGNFLPIYGSHDTSLKFRRQIKWKNEIKDLVWEEIVRAKITGQAAILKSFDKNGTELLESYIRELQPGDDTNREGHAAKVYFNSLFGTDFSRGEECAVNAALNYGYSIILSAFAREIVANGFSTQLGIFHDNIFNEYNLACDLMEPFRPFVDYSVYKMHPEKLEHDEKMLIADILNRKVLIGGKIQYITNAIKIYTKSVLDSLCEEDMSFLRFPDYELQIYEDNSFL